MTMNTGSTSTAFVRATQYSDFIISVLPEIILPDMFTRDVTDFGIGTTLNIPTTGTVTLQEAAEDTPLAFTKIDSGNVQLTISEYIGDAWKVTDDLKEDQALIDRLLAERGVQSSRALAEYFETKFLAQCNSAQTADNDNAVNGIDHRFVAGGDATSGVFDIEDFSRMKYVFDKANVPQVGRIAIVDPSVEYTINNLAAAQGFTNDPMFTGIKTEGFAMSHKFVRNIFGWDIWTSNLLTPTTVSEGNSNLTARDGTTTFTGTTLGYIPNVFMCVADDNCKPIMRAWRRPPKAEGWRDPEERADKFQVTARFGLGAQRIDTLGIILSNPSV